MTVSSGGYVPAGQRRTDGRLPSGLARRRHRLYRDLQQASVVEGVAPQRVLSAAIQRVRVCRSAHAFRGD